MPIIHQVLSNRNSSTTAETVFSGGRYLLGDYRTCLLPDRLEGALLARTYYKFSSYEAKLPILPEIGKLNDEEMSFYYTEFTEPVPNEGNDGGIPTESILTAVFDSEDDDDEKYRD